MGITQQPLRLGREKVRTLFESSISRLFDAHFVGSLQNLNLLFEFDQKVIVAHTHANTHKHTPEHVSTHTLSLSFTDTNIHEHTNTQTHKHTNTQTHKHTNT
jgi:hypothetical protein